jgi:hypothetical protein
MNMAGMSWWLKHCLKKEEAVSKVTMKAPVNRGLFPFPVGCVLTANHHANRKRISLE